MRDSISNTEILADDVAQIRNQWARAVSRTLMQAGLSPAQAVAMACVLARTLRGRHLHKPPSPEKIIKDIATARRNRRIKAAFTGHNHAALGRRHGLHERTIRKILERG